MPKILVVDDENVHLDILCGLLRPQFQVVIAKSGEQAFQRLAYPPLPDLILLDITMPGMDGYQVCQRLQEDPKTVGIPIIFITGKHEDEDETRGLAAGAVDFIRKPFNPKVVMARIQTHLALLQQKARLVELNDIKNRFLGMAAHDLRNPLTTICGFSDMLLNVELSDDERTMFTTTIHNVANQMLHLINDLLDVTAIESGQFALNPKDNDLAGLTEERLLLVASLAAKKGIGIVRQLEATPALSFDRDRLAQVIDNLLGNAIKFTFPDSPITVCTGEEHGLVFFKVMDRGPGIPEHEKDRLFGAFQKLSTKPTAKERGTGLGLAIVKKIIDAHRGAITVENRPGGGSIFTVFLSRL